MDNKLIPICNRCVDGILVKVRDVQLIHDFSLDLFADSILQLFVLNEKFDLPLDSGVPVVLDCVVGSSRKKFCNDCPLVSEAT